jgi:hypothetical protein
MPGVLKTDCRVKPEVKSFTRLETRSSCTGGGNETTEEGS